MNKVLLFGSTIVATLAKPIAEPRRLNGGGTGGAEADWVPANLAGGCNFLPTASLFDYAVDAGFDNVGGVDNGVANTAAYTQQGSTSIAAWHSTAAIHLGTFAIDFKLLNYKAAAHSSNQKAGTSDVLDGIYKYYKFVETSTAGSYNWEVEDGFALGSGDESAKGVESMVTVCFFKNSEPAACNGADYKQEVAIDLPLPNGGTSATVTTQKVSVALRKILGVASMCGAGDNGYDLSGGGAQDIFVWADLQAESTMEYTITVNLVDSYGADFANPATPQADREQDLALLGTRNAVVQYQIDASHSHKLHDLLFVEGDVTNDVTELAGTFDNTGEGMSINYHIGHSVTGGVERDASPVNTADCTSALTVDAQGNKDATIANQNAHWHCFRSGTPSFPDIGQGNDLDATTMTESDSGGLTDASLANLAIATSPLDPSHPGCTAKLTVDCTIPALTITGKDTRLCTEGDAYTDEVDGVDGVTHDDTTSSTEDCLKSAFWLRSYEYQAYDPLTVDYEAAIVQAVRLGGSRRYPKGADSASDGDEVSEMFGAEDAEGDPWKCGDGNCATQDPYKVLYAGTAESKMSCASSGAIAGVSGDVSQSKTSTTGLGAAAVWSQVCTLTNPGLDSGGKTILTPPLNYPESYVFAVVSYTYDRKDMAVKVVSETGVVEEAGGVSDTDVTDLEEFEGVTEANVAGDDVDTDNNAQTRRLLRSVASKPAINGKFELVDAIQHMPTLK